MNTIEIDAATVAVNAARRLCAETCEARDAVAWAQCQPDPDSRVIYAAAQAAHEAAVSAWKAAKLRLRDARSAASGDDA